MNRFAWLTCFACLTFALVGCAAEEAPEGDAEETAVTAPAGDSTEGETQLVDFTNEDGKLVCPLMGTELDSKEDAVGWVEYDGVNYAMCCAPCMENGSKNPEMVAQKAAEL